MNEKDKKILNNSKEIVRLAKEYHKLKILVSRCVFAASMFERRIAELLEESGMRFFAEPDAGITVAKSDEEEFDYDVEGLQKVLGDDFGKVVGTVNGAEFDNLVIRYPLILNYRKKIGEFANVVIRVNKDIL
jgi:hypothetical protein